MDMEMKRTRKQQPRTVAECWAWFWATKGASWEDVFAKLDAINAPYSHTFPRLLTTAEIAPAWAAMKAAEAGNGVREAA